MKDKLEDFIKNNKAAFDDQEPSAALWVRIENKLPSTIKAMPKQGRIVRMYGIKWVAAAVCVLVAGMFFMMHMVNNKEQKTPAIAAVQPQQQDSTKAPVFSLQNVPDSAQQNNSTVPEIESREVSNSNQVKNNDSKIAEPLLHADKSELYHYTQLISIRQRKMAALKKKAPELYQQFAKDHEALEQSYNELRKKQKHGFNSEQLLEAMVQNLKMQSDLLSKQLAIIKSFNTKKISNETNYNSL